MRIQNNIMAMNTHRQLAINNLNQTKSTEKLSSGYRINRAADDAAGLTISEKMRSQIRGLNQASANAQDGISLVQAAEGALQETHSILQRMRELSVKAANDVNETEDRGAIKAEMDQLTSEVDRIAFTTEFNKKTLLDGSLSNGKFGKAVTSNITGVNVSATSTIPEGEQTATVNTAATQAAFGAIVVGAASTASGQITISGGALGTKSLAIDVGASDSITTITTNIAKSLTSALGKDFVVSDGGAAGVTLTSRTTGLTSLGNFTVSANGTDATVSGGTVTEGKYADITGYATADGKNYTNGTTGVSFRLTKDVGASEQLKFNVATGSTLTLQVGANTGVDQTIGVNVAQLTASGLGITGLSVDTHKNSQTAIDAIESAISIVSQQRSSLGAVQNRLEHTVANVDTVSENLQAAESRIRDVDMAKEMMAFTKNNILSQAATAMLAQANQAPQGVLQLLR